MNLERDKLGDVSVRQPDHVVHREFPSETVILNLKTGTYHGLNPIGGRMLAELNGAASVGAAAAKLAADFDQSLDVVEQDLYGFCAGMVERGLLVVEPARR